MARALTCFRQAVFVLIWFRKREDLTVLGAGFGISRATAYRYRDEALAVLAAQAPDLTEALKRVKDDGWAYVILDGKIVDTDRSRVAKTISRKGHQIDAWFSGKTGDFGGNIQAVMRPDGLPVWVSAVEPGLDPRPDRRPRTRAGSPVRRSRLWSAHPGRPRLPRCRHRRAHPVQATRRRAPPRHRQPHLQQAAAVPTRHRRTRLRPTQPTLAGPAARDRMPAEDRRHRQRGSRTHPFRTPIHLLLRSPEWKR